MIVTLDGPAGSGKSSTAREVARRLGFRHLDSGAFYRALTRTLLDSGLAPEDWSRLTPGQLDELGVRGVATEDGYRLEARGADLTGLIRSPEVNAHVSAVAALPAVREWLLGRLREAARGTDLVTDGRDMGTVVFPQADLKFYLDASPATRAGRRLRETGHDPRQPDVLAAEIARIEARDRADAGRTLAPLRQPADALRVDTTELAFEEQVEWIVAKVRERKGEREGRKERQQEEKRNPRAAEGERGPAQ
ncbi:MAG TPA: (d)CMP kinase [Longimicrobiales bacterium]|nr:(d)CMP kinase [Longimicrobiales bacterium]